jgi:hypothetical protein
MDHGCAAPGLVLSGSLIVALLRFMGTSRTCATPGVDRNQTLLWEPATSLYISNLHIHLRVLTFIYTSTFTMLVPEHLASTVDQLDSWDSRCFRELYDGIRPRKLNAVGVAFTPTNLIASWIDTAGSLQFLKQPVSPEYRQLYEKTVDTYGDNRHNPYHGYGNDLTAMFALNFSPITSALAERLGHEPTYTAFFLPKVFEDSMCRIAGQALHSFGNRCSVPPRATNLAMGVPWDFWDGKNLAGRPIERQYSDPNLLPNYVLQLEYEQDHLSAYFQEIDLELELVFICGYDKFSRECRERFRKVSLASSHADDKKEIDKKTQDLGAQAYDERLTAFINDFIPTWTQSSLFNGLEDIRAIVVAGDISAASAAEVGEIAQKAVRTGIPRVLTDEDPSAVLIRGAAMRAHYFASASKAAGCSRKKLTDEQYEQTMRNYEKWVHEKLAEYLKGPELESPEVWARRKPKLITAAGEK